MLPLRWFSKNMGSNIILIVWCMVYWRGASSFPLHFKLRNINHIWEQSTSSNCTVCISNLTTVINKLGGRIITFHNTHTCLCISLYVQHLFGFFVERQSLDLVTKALNWSVVGETGVFVPSAVRTGERRESTQYECDALAVARTFSDGVVWYLLESDIHHTQTATHLYRCVLTSFNVNTFCHCQGTWN